MKKCPFCAQEIQDAAVLCQHCRRELSAAPPPTQPKAVGWKTVVIALMAVPLMIGIFMWMDAPPAPPAPGKSAALTAKADPDATGGKSLLAASVSTLPKGFIPDSITRTYEHLARSGKSEFESTAAYRARLEKNAKTNVYGFFVEPVSAAYDADRQQSVLRLRLIASEWYGWTDIHDNSVLVPVNDSTKEAEYPASTALGVKMMIKKTSRTAYGLAAGPVPSVVFRERMGSGLEGRYAEVRIRMSPDEAKRRQPSLSFLLLAAPATTTSVRTSNHSSKGSEATVASPTTWEGQAFGVHVSVFDLHVWVVDLEKGDVLLKTTLAEALRMRR